MWKKICIALVSGLALGPGVALGQTTTTTFDPFQGITAGIAQGMDVGMDVIIKSGGEAGSSNSDLQGGNVVIGTDPVDEIFQGAVVRDDVDLQANNSTNTTQGLNIIQGTVAVLNVQGAVINDTVTIESIGGSGNVQAVNLVKQQ